MPPAYPATGSRISRIGRSTRALARRPAEREESTVSGDIDKFWYNLQTGKVERGFASPMADRAGPFDTEEEAARAPELMKQRSREWDEDDAREAAWGDETEK
jgi:hypothetical protein